MICVFSELWRKENTLQHTLTSLKEELAKADQALRSMAGKVKFNRGFRLALKNDWILYCHIYLIFLYHHLVFICFVSLVISIKFSAFYVFILWKFKLLISNGYALMEHEYMVACKIEKNWYLWKCSWSIAITYYHHKLMIIWFYLFSFYFPRSFVKVKENNFWSNIQGWAKVRVQIGN